MGIQSGGVEVIGEMLVRISRYLTGHPTENDILYESYSNLRTSLDLWQCILPSPSYHTIYIRLDPTPDQIIPFP